MESNKMSGNRQAQRRRVMGYFIKAAAELMEEDGMEGVTIRKVADRAAFNSATLYNYFDNLDHLIYFALIKYTKNYVRALAAAVHSGRSPYAIYLRVWECFCLEAFQNPYCFYRLFFTQQDGTLSRTLREYYDIFPEEVENQSPVILDMLSEANIFIRNWKLLRPVWPEDQVSDDTLSTINAVVIYAFQGMLYNKLHGRDDRSAEELTDDMMRMVRLVTALPPDPGERDGEEAAGR